MLAKATAEEVCREVLNEILAKSPDDEIDLTDVKLRVARLYGLNYLPSNSEILSHARENEKDKVRSILLLKPIRSLSGVNVVAVMTEPSENALTDVVDIVQTSLAFHQATLDLSPPP